LALATGAVEAMVVDIQCIMQALAPIADQYHTTLITTSRKAKITGATHMEFNEHEALNIAKDIVKVGCDNFPKRGETEKVYIPNVSAPLVAGFSHEYLRYMQGGYYRGSFRPLNDAIMTGRIRGVAGVVGCNNPRTPHDYTHNYVVQGGLDHLLGIEDEFQFATNLFFPAFADHALNLFAARHRVLCAKDDIDTRSDKVSADGQRLFAHPFRRETDCR
jgi:hypothetical protein